MNGNAPGYANIMKALSELKQEMKTRQEKVANRQESKIEKFKNDLGPPQTRVKKR